MKKCLLILLLATGPILAQEGARYLIITTDALAPAIQPLAEWKHASGMKCKVTTLSEIGGSDTTAIKNYIRNAYNNWPIRPEYVLLVGFPPALPSRYYRIQQGWSYYSDHFYGDINNDLYMEIPVGRFPARSARQCSVMVAKTLAYEKTPDLTDTLWMRRLTTVVRENYDSDDTIYWNDVRLFARLADSNNFVNCDSLSRARGHTSTDVMNSVNNGTAFVLYRGTAVNYWYEPFNNINPGATNNGKKLPIILSITCQTLTLAPNESMVCEAWMRAGTVANLRGAVAVVGNTHSLNSSTTTVLKRSTVARTFARAVFQEGKYKLGKAVIRAKDSLYRAFNDVADYRGFNLYGDPDLDIWTATPTLPTVNHPTEISPGPQEFAVQVLLNAQPFHNALVCVSMDSSVYEYGYTDPYGAIAFNINPPDTGTLRLVVTGHNLYPYDVLIPVTRVGIAEAPQPLSIVRVNATPQTFSHRTRLNWSPASVKADITIYDATGKPVFTVKEASSGFVWNGTDNHGRTCPAGVYLCTINTNSENAPLQTKVLKIQ